MKKVLFLMLLSAVCQQLLFAQCTPNQAIKDSTFGVYPKPYDKAVYPNGGIDKSACIGKPYKYQLTAKVPDSIPVAQLGGIKIPLDSIKVAKTGAVTGLPQGMSYACNPPNCVFPKNSLGCLYMYGTATSANAAGDYDLKIEMTAYLNTIIGAFPQKVTFPDATIAPGKYTLKLEGTNSTTCFVTDVNDKSENILHIAASPNPTNDMTIISFFALENDAFDFVVTNAAGQIVHKRKVAVQSGINTLTFEAGNLAEGMYIYYLGNNKGKAVNRLIINR